MTTHRLLGATSGPSSWAADSNNVSVGVEFYVTDACEATAVHFWVPAAGWSGTMTGRIYSVDSATTGTVQGSAATFTVSGTGWQTATFSTPVPLTISQRYRAVVTNISTGSNVAYASTSLYFSTGPAASGITDGPLVAPNGASATGADQGSYVYGGTAAFPVNSFNSTNYWVDVTVATTTPTDPGAGDILLEDGTGGYLLEDGTGVLRLDTLLSATPEGSGIGTLTFTGAATGQRTPKASGTGSFTFTGAASGKRTPKASGSGTLTFTGAASGIHPPNEGAGSGTFGFTGAAVGRRAPKSSGTGAYGFTGSSAGATARRGTGSGTHSFTGAASGRRTPKASGAGDYNYTGTATGARTPKAGGAGVFAFAGSASGVAPTPGVREGSASGAFAFAGSASGKRTPRGSGAGGFDYAGAAVGARASTGAGSGSFVFAGDAQGTGQTSAPPIRRSAIVTTRGRTLW